PHHASAYDYDFSSLLDVHEHSPIPLGTPDGNNSPSRKGVARIYPGSPAVNLPQGHLPIGVLPPSALVRPFGFAQSGQLR
ncbi:MAG: hypothetical protein ACE5JL_13185, partial [Dehalococcoidia bacterium]